MPRSGKIGPTLEMGYTAMVKSRRTGDTPSSKAASRSGHTTRQTTSSRPDGVDHLDAPLQEWLAVVAETAAADADAPVQLLGEYLAILAEAAITGRRPEKEELSAVRHRGQRAAEEGVDANRAVDLYLSAAWRLWQGIPSQLPTRQPEDVRAAAEAVLRVTTDAVGVLVEGHQDARRQFIRQEESTRREFVDDLLRGDADVSRLIERAEPFGLDLGRSHQILLAAPVTSPTSLERGAVVMERIMVDHFGDREVLVATKDDLVVMLVPGELRNVVSGVPVLDPAAFTLVDTPATTSGGWQRGAPSPARTESHVPTKKLARPSCWLGDWV